MRLLMLTPLILAATLIAAGAEDPKRSPADSERSELVEAAKKAKEKRAASSKRVITNADVKKSKGKIVETTLAPLPIEVVPEENLLEAHERSKEQKASTALALGTAREKVAVLEKELVAIEQAYYEENDLDRRDRELVRRFNDTKSKLDEALKELEALEPKAKPATELQSGPVVIVKDPE